MVQKSNLGAVTVQKANGHGGQLRFKSGDTYVGIVSDAGSMDGVGEYTWADGVKYDGEFCNSTIEGRGIYQWPDGSSYDGQVCAGLRHGTGTFTGPNGTPRYQGEWKQGQRHGTGKLEYPGGDVYEGQWANDMREGQGTLTHVGGNHYTGSWAKDAKNGHGTFHWFDRCERYVGEWVDNKSHGHGEHTWLRAQQKANPFQLRERYVGEWWCGMRQGYGTFYLASGARYVGEWSANRKHGAGLFAFDDGSLYEGLFEADRMTDGQLRGTSDLFTYLDLTHLVSPSEHDATCAAIRHVLTRHNTDIKQAYRFYSSMGCIAEDSFDLTLAQFRVFVSDARLISRAMPIATLDQLAMRSASSQPIARRLPRPLVLATAVASAAGTTGEVEEIRHARHYVRGGAHDGERTLLLRDFVQALVEIAAAGVSNLPHHADVGPSPTPAMALALINVFESMANMTPSCVAVSAKRGPIDREHGCATVNVNESAELRARLQLAYGFYAASEVMFRVWTLSIHCPSLLDAAIIDRKHFPSFYARRYHGASVVR